MSNQIGRIRTIGIAAQPTFGTAAASPTFVLPLLDTPKVEPVQNKERNMAALGSAYQSNSVVNTTQMGTFPLNLKIDEDHLPLFFKQRFSITSSQITGETTVYEHVLNYTNNTNNWYTLFLEDDNRTSYLMKDALFSELNVISDTGFLRLEGSAQGQMPSVWTGSNTVVQPKDFVGRNASFNLGDYTASKAAFDTLSATLNHSFNLSADDNNFGLGSGAMQIQQLTEDEFTAEVQANFPNTDQRDDFVNNTAKKYDLTIEDTGRFVTGSVTSVSPYIQFDYAKGFVEGWTEDGGLADILTETLTLHPVDEVGVTDAPLKITVKNATASY